MSENTYQAAHGIEAPAHQFVTSDGALIRFRMRGSGPALLMLHGWSQSGAMFHHQLAGLADRFTVIAPDLRGQGDSPRPAGGLRMSRLAADVRELMDHLALGQAAILGWSMGVSVLWSYIDLFGTSRLTKLICVDQPAALTIQPEMSAEEVIECGGLFTWGQVGELCASLRSPDGAAVRAGFVNSMVTPHISPVLLAWIQQENAKTSTEVAAHLLWSHCSQDWRDVLPRIDRPTLVICGDCSHVDARSQFFIQRKIRNSVIRKFSREEGGAHFMFLEAPDVFNDVIREFMSA